MFTAKVMINNRDAGITLELWTMGNRAGQTPQLVARTFRYESETLQSVIYSFDKLETDEGTTELMAKLIRMTDPQKQHGPHSKHNVMWDEIEHALKLFTQF